MVLSVLPLAVSCLMRRFVMLLSAEHAGTELTMGWPKDQPPVALTPAALMRSCKHSTLSAEARAGRWGRGERGGSNN